MAYYDKYGAEYSDDKKTLIRVPVTHHGVYEIAHGTEYVSFNAFKDCVFITTIIIPSTLDEVSDDGDCDFGVLDSCKKLLHIYVAPSNKNFFSIDGILYQKNYHSWDESIKCTMVIAYPPAKGGRFKLPNDVFITELERANCAIWCTPSVLPKLEISADNPRYTLVDGVLYDKNVETLIKVPVELKGQYKMPDSVEVIAYDAFRGCKKIRTIIFGESLDRYAPDQAEMTLHEQLQDCNALSEVSAPDNNNFIITRGFIEQYVNDYSSKTDLVYYIPRRSIKTAVLPSADYIFMSDVFARCNTIQHFSADINGCIEEEVFTNTAFYKNESNWKNGMLFINDILIKVRADYNEEELIIPPKSRVITSNSINCDNVRTIIVSEGVCDFNDSAIKCKNLRTIKFPSTISWRYLDEYTNGTIDDYHVEKILIPKGYRDFFLMFLTHRDSIYEYDEIGNEQPIAPLSNEENDFYQHRTIKGFPCFWQYAAIKKELLNGKGLTDCQIHTIAFPTNKNNETCWHSMSMMDPRRMMWYIEKCFKDNGYILKSLNFKDEKQNTDKIYYIEKCD